MNSILNFGINFSDKKWYIVLRDILFLFIVYSICGWIYEELVFILKLNQVVNRGALFGPWLPIYGFGGLIIISLFYRFKDKKIMLGKLNIRPLVLFFETVIFATLVELVATYLMDFTGGNFKSLWDYSNEFMNFEGRIALIPDLKFGIVALVGIYFLEPLLIKFLSNKEQSLIDGLSVVIFMLFFVDAFARIWLGNNFVG